MPDLPVTIPDDQRQVAGENDNQQVYQTHRGKMPTSRDLNDRPTRKIKDDLHGWGRYQS